MKQVIKKQTHYSVLLMRDDCEVRSYRVSRVVLRMLCLFFLLLLLGGGLGIAGGVHYWEKAQRLSRNYSAAAEELKEVRLQLETMTNRQVIASFRETDLASLMPRNTEIVAEAEPESPAPDSGVGVDILAPLNGVQETPPEPAAEEVQAAGPPGQESAARDGATAQEDGLLAIDANDSPIRIDNFQARSSGLQRIRLRYTLVAASQQQVSGQARYRVHLTNGTSHDLAVQSSDSARFSIARMKQMEGVGRLPQGVRPEMLQSVQVIVELENGPAYMARFPFSDN